jgi:hypothetical protein
VKHALRLAVALGAATLVAPTIAGDERVAHAALERAIASPVGGGIVRPREIAFRLDAGPSSDIDWLLPFRDAAIERLGPMRLYLAGRWGRWHDDPWNEFAWTGAHESPLDPRPNASLERDWVLDGSSDSQAFHFDSEEPIDWSLHGWHESADALDGEARAALFAALFGRTVAPQALFDDGGSPFFATGPSLVSNGFGAIFRLPPAKPLRDWRCKRGPVHVMRNDGEGGRFELVRCDGSMALDALDRVSILARPVDVASPGDRLPDEPDAESWSARGEWLPGVRVVHPRLVWALQGLADAFPRRSLVIYSGYRPGAEVNDGSGHRSQHAEGRALDVAVMRVPNEQVFEACKALRDVGCGFYPNNKFVHLHVRRAHSGKASWIDASEPGQSAEYVKHWPTIEPF